MNDPLSPVAEMRLLFLNARLYFRSISTLPLVPTRRCEPRPRHRAPGEAARCPPAHCYICRLSSTAALKCRGETTFATNLFLSFWPFSFCS